MKKISTPNRQQNLGQDNPYGSLSDPKYNLMGNSDFENQAAAANNNMRRERRGSKFSISSKNGQREGYHPVVPH